MKGRLFNYWNRSEEGPMLSEKDFDLKVYWPAVKRLVKKYNIQYKPDEIVPQDIELINNIYKAAKELFIEVGVYNVTTKRQIKWTEEEVDAIMKVFPSSSTIGEGRDATTMVKRHLNDPRPTGNILARVLGSQDPALIDRVFYAYASEERLDHVCFQGIIPQIGGADVRPWSPAEMVSELKRVAAVEWARKAAGRPGLADCSSAPVSLQAAMAAMNSDSGMRKGDVRHVYIMPHLKTSYEQFTRTVSTFAFGHHQWGIGQAYIGGLSGAPNTAAVATTAELFAYCMLYNPSYLGLWSADNLYFATTSRTALWTNFHAGAAWTNNTNTFSVAGAPWGVVVSGPCCETYFWEHAAGAIGCAVTGMFSGGGTGWQSGGHMGATPIGARFASEVCDAACEAQIGFAEANRLVKYCLAKYEERMLARDLHKTGKPFDQCYDIESCQPLPEYVEIYEKVKAELREQGLKNL